MAYNRVDYGGNTLIDLTGDTVTPEKLAKGETAHDMTGAQIVGTMDGTTATKCNCVSDLHAIWDVFSERGDVGAYALYCASDRSLTLLCAWSEPASLHGKDVTWSSTEVEDAPWRDISDDIDTITIETSFWAFKPERLNDWFGGMHVTEINGLYNIDTSKVQEFWNLFAGCSSLTTADASGWVINGDCNLSGLFDGCQSLTTADASGWVINGDCDLFGLFASCQSLTTADASGWVINGDCDLSGLFASCSSLTTVDASGWVIDSTTRGILCPMMFADCTSLKTIYGDEWEIADGDNMFLECTSIVGGNGTTYDETRVDASMAHIDTASNPGYFTDVNDKE